MLLMISLDCYVGSLTNSLKKKTKGDYQPKKNETAFRYIAIKYNNKILLSAIYIFC